MCSTSGISHRALDYVFGVPLARGFRRIHTNVNMSYYNYSQDEDEFSRKIIRYWSNFVKTGFVYLFCKLSSISLLARNPNRGSVSDRTSDTQWKNYTSAEHNYMFFQLNDIRNEPNYFDSMYQFWSDCFQTEKNGGCQQAPWMKMKRHLLPFLLIVLVLVLLLITCLVCQQVQKKKKRYLSSQARLPIDQLQYPHLIST